jgi:ATP-dependent DNA ligase
VFSIAEIGLNHGGDLRQALELVDGAAWAGAAAVKLQTLDAECLVALRMKFSPMRLLRIPESFHHREWLFEPKMDGFRALAHTKQVTSRLFRLPVWQSSSVPEQQE